MGNGGVLSLATVLLILGGTRADGASCRGDDWRNPPLVPYRQERKDREKDKRSKGQSSHAAWKSEAEMVLRQQYD